MTDQEILDNAPEGATHIDINMPIFYYKIDEFVTEYFIGGIWKDACNTIPAVENIRSLADIKRIVELERENTKNLGWIAKAMMRGLTDIFCGDELIKIAESNNIEQQIKGINYVINNAQQGDDTGIHYFTVQSVLAICEEMKERAKQLKEQGDE